MSMTPSPATPRRPLVPSRSESEPRPNTSGIYGMWRYKSPASSYGDSLGSPALPDTPATVPNFPVTPKRWTYSKLPAISEDSSPIPASLQKYVDMTSTPYKKETLGAIRFAIHNADSGKHEKGINQMARLSPALPSDEDPFTVKAIPTNVNYPENVVNLNANDPIPKVATTANKFTTLMPIQETPIREQRVMGVANRGTTKPTSGHLMNTSTHGMTNPNSKNFMMNGNLGMTIPTTGQFMNTGNHGMTTPTIGQFMNTGDHGITTPTSGQFMNTGNNGMANQTPGQLMNTSHLGTMLPISFQVQLHKVFENAHLVTDANAQALLAPDACIFVANLPRCMTDDVLLMNVKEFFSQYGLCWVKIRRNALNNTPHAFVQYRGPKEAHVALVRGSKEHIGGRPCRTEMVVAPRTLYVSKIDGEAFSKDAVYAILGTFGAIADICEPNYGERMLYSLNPGYLVRMSYYQSALDAVLAYRGHGDWVVVHNHEASCCLGSMSMAPIPSIPNGYTECLFVANLQVGTSLETIKSMFTIYGQISFINTRAGAPLVLRNEIGYDFTVMPTIQAFIYYVEPGSVFRAVQYQEAIPAHANRIRIQPKRGVPFVSPIASQVFVRTQANSSQDVHPGPISRRATGAMNPRGFQFRSWI